MNVKLENIACWLLEYTMWTLIWNLNTLLFAAILAQFHQNPQEAFHCLMQDKQYTNLKTPLMALIPPLFIQIVLSRKKQSIFKMLDYIFNL